MVSDARQRMASLKGTSVGLVLTEFLKERIEEKTKQLVNCTDATFKHQQGRVMELQDLVKYLESKGE